MSRLLKYSALIVIVGTVPVIYYKRKHNIKSIIVFDLDRTLIDSELESSVKKQNMGIFKPHDFVVNPHGKPYYVWVRPFVQHIIPFLARFYTLHIYTRATKEYTDEILDKIFTKSYFTSKHYRDTVAIHEYKNLVVIDGSPQDKLLIDDLSSNHRENKDNLASSFYHIPPYKMHNRFDFEMLKLLFNLYFTINDTKEFQN